MKEADGLAGFAEDDETWQSGEKRPNGRQSMSALPDQPPIQPKSSCSDSQTLTCPECGVGRFYKAGFRYLADGSSVQRYLCLGCGHRFSRWNHSESSEHVQKIHKQLLNSPADYPSNAEYRVADGAMVNLAETQETRFGTAQRESTKVDEATIKGKLVEFAFWMQKQGYKELTIKSRILRLETLARRGANLLDPESVKRTIALQQTWEDGTKANVVDAYTCFLEKEGLTWIPPRYTRLEKIPFIPGEAELNQLIGSCGKTLSTFLQGLKETGADPGELAAITLKDVNKEARTITINKPVKGHRPRILPVSVELIRRLEDITKGSERIFDDLLLRRAFYYKRKTTARKLSNPRLLNITFITFRHWFGTMEYHKTKDILHVQRLLGHKNIQNTLIYIDLESKIFNNSSDGFTTRVAHNVGEACRLIEVGFEYVTGEYNDGGKIFRRRN